VLIKQTTETAEMLIIFGIWWLSIVCDLGLFLFCI